MEMENRKVSDSIVETVHMVRPQHLNASDRLFGGALMQWIDEVAGMVAKRHTRRNVITASVDSLSFLRGAYVKDTVVIIGKVTYVGNTSMEVKVDTYVEALSGERTPINHAYFTMRSGGKTFITFLFDSVSVWAISIPFAYFLMNFTELHIVLVYLFCQLISIIKCIIGYVLVKKGVWINNIVE